MSLPRPINLSQASPVSLFRETRPSGERDHTPHGGGEVPGTVATIFARLLINQVTRFGTFSFIKASIQGFAGLLGDI